MNSLWEMYGDDIKPAACEWCEITHVLLYTFDDNIVCEACLRSEEAEEPYHGLTNEERNR